MSPMALTALPLSPLHVGDGSEWTPDAYKLEGDELIRFDPQAVTRGLAPAEARGFAAAVDRGDLGAAQRLLRDAVKRDQIRERVRVSAESRREVAEALAGKRRRGAINPFARGSQGPYLPGSAVKGALRTALLSAWVQPKLAHYQDWLSRQNIRGGRSGPASTRLQEQVLGALDRDPFRFIRVFDTALPVEHLRIERVVPHHRERSRAGDGKGMQMHFECLRPGIESAFTLVLDVQAERAVAAANLGAAKAPERPIGTRELLRAVNDFYRHRLQVERDRFFDQPWLTPLPEVEADGFPLLLRVGRFSHFESASVEGFRQGWQPQGKRSMTEGSTRAVVRQGDVTLPFGWLLLVPAGQEKRLAPLAGLTARRERAEPSSTTAAPGGRGRAAPLASSLAGRRGRVDEEPVEVERDEGAVLLVRFLNDGDLEEVQRDEFQPED